MAIGMSGEEFWHGPPRLAVAYREAERIKRENRYQAEWRAGIYTFQALMAAAPALKAFAKAEEHEYPREPLFSSTAKAVSEEEKNESLMEQGKAAFMEMANRFNARFAERGDQGEDR